MKDKDLLLKDICSRLLYGVKVKVSIFKKWGDYTLFYSYFTVFDNGKVGDRCLQGKTTLEITYRDSVVIDSVLLWKEE